MAILKFGVGEITNVTLDYNEPVYEPPKGSFSEQWRYGCNGKLDIFYATKTLHTMIQTLGKVEGDRLEISKQNKTNDSGKTFQEFIVDGTTMDDLNKGVARSLPDAPVSLSSDLFGDEPRAEEPTETAPGSGTAIGVTHQEFADAMKPINEALKALNDKIEAVRKEVVPF